MQSETASSPDRRVKRDRRRKRGEHLVWVSVTGVVAIVMFAVLAIVGLTRLNDVVSELDTLRADNQQASCLQQNDTTLRLRQSFASSVKAVVPPGSTDPRIETFMTRYLGAVNARLPFRDCSREGIKAYFANPPAPVACDPDGKGFCTTDPGG